MSSMFQATAAKDAASKKMDGMKSMSTKDTNWDYYSPPPRASPSVNTNSRPKAPPPPPPKRMVDAPTGREVPQNALPGARPAPVKKRTAVPLSTRGPMPPPIIHSTRPDLITPSQSPAPSNRPTPSASPVPSLRPALPTRKASQSSLPTLPARRPSYNEQIDWENLSQEDKEVFFSWLDEFFARKT